MTSLLAFDIAVMQLVHAHRLPMLDLFFSLLTHLGDARVITVVGLSMAFVLWRHRRFEYKAGLALAIFGSLATSYGIKLLVERARPEEAFSLIEVVGYSFPSMHATMAMATYGFLAYMVYRLMHPPHHRAPWIAFLLVLVALVGFSRVYVGVHYATDVLAGFAVGALFVYLGIRAARALSRRSRDS